MILIFLLITIFLEMEKVAVNPQTGPGFLGR